jgi:putative RecB family exonuclease
VKTSALPAAAPGPFEGMVYSPSRLAAFEQCPLKFRFKYIDKADVPSFTSIEAFMGNVVHRTLEALYQQAREGGVPETPDMLVLYHRFWEEAWSPAVRVVKAGRTAGEYRDDGARCVRVYCDRHRPFQKGKVVALEERLTFALDEAGRFRMQGVVDRLTEKEEGRLEIHDYKTSARMPTPEDVRRDVQLALYQVGVEKRWPETRSVTLIWHYLRHGREVRFRRSPESQARLLVDTVARIERIERAEIFPARESPLCRWCEFQTICPAFQARRDGAR